MTKKKIVGAAITDSEFALLEAIKRKRGCNNTEALKFAIQSVPAEYHEEAEHEEMEQGTTSSES